MRSQRSGVPKATNTTIDMMTTVRRKLVPHRIWATLCLCTEATSRESPASSAWYTLVLGTVICVNPTDIRHQSDDEQVRNKYEESHPHPRLAR